MVWAWMTGGFFSVTSPFGLLITRPAAASSEARRGRTRNVMSRPACSILPPKYPPIAPAPTMRMRISQFLVLLDGDDLAFEMTLQRVSWVRDQLTSRYDQSARHQPPRLEWPPQWQTTQCSWTRNRARRPRWPAPRRRPPD